MAEPRTVDEERAYIENLLNTRFNYYLLFVSVLLVPIAGDNSLTPTGRTFLLAFGAAISALMAVMVVRTKLLLGVLLDELEGNHPYKYASRIVGRKPWPFRINANDLMIWVVGLTFMVFVAGAMAASAPSQVLFKEQAAPVQPQR